MLARWSIRTKHYILLGVLLVLVVSLATSSLMGSFAYRWLAKGVSYRANELPLASLLSQRVTDLRITFSRAQQLRKLEAETGQSLLESQLVRQELGNSLLPVYETLRDYRAKVAHNESLDEVIGDHAQELEAVAQIEQTLAEIESLNRTTDWMTSGLEADELAAKLERVAGLSGELPNFLRDRMHAFLEEVRGQYRTWIAVAIVGVGLSVGQLFLLGWLFYHWVFRPLRILVQGSRRVAQGDLHHRIRLDTQDEMSELAAAMNDMTAYFQQTSDELNEKVRQRTQEVVRQEQLASVGFLAAGVAHEINNPLAAIAWSAESLESRLEELYERAAGSCGEEQRAEIAEARRYLRMILDEAYRCSGITEKLLNFSRLGNVERQPTDLRPLVQEVLEMVRHVGKYKAKQVDLEPGEAVVASVCVPEMKQVVLNLVTNALDSLEPGGQVTVRLAAQAGQAELLVTDNGCGMDAETLQNLFQPFFTRRRDGAGTGLGLSITFQIVADHGGQIVAASDGPGRGSRLRVTLPLATTEKESNYRYQAA